MANLKQRAEAMIFDYATTNRTDYQTTKLKQPVFTEYKEKPTILKIRPPPLKDLHTLGSWKTNHIPFSLFHKPRPHIDTDPTRVQQPYIKSPDTGKENARRTRPRLVMTPAVSVDDVEDPEARALLLDYMYTSDMTRSMREGLQPYFRVVAPIPDLPTNANPLRLPNVMPPYVSPEWRMESCTWDRKQLRGYCDTTEHFWLSQQLPPCTACEASNAAIAHKNITVK